MVGSQLLFEAECLPDLTWLDNAWGDYPYEDLAYEYETQYGQETDESRPGRNLLEPAYNVPNPLFFEFHVQEETPSLPTTPALPFSPEQAAPQPCTSYSDVVNNSDSSHSQGRRYHCAECDRLFKLEKDFRRHVETTKAHQLAVFQCCCMHTSGRKDNFLQHVERKKPCIPAVPFVCSCGYRIESNSPDAVALLLKHVKPCGQRKRGRPKK
ncbi:hypothetical protein HDV64DRAFT_195827 [Trichoderma sp. TUCIM 5745]